MTKENYVALFIILICLIASAVSLFLKGKWSKEDNKSKEANTSLTDDYDDIWRGEF